jgi:hypothetical protein
LLTRIPFFKLKTQDEAISIPEYNLQYKNTLQELSPRLTLILKKL